jgi:hypothetical protein
MGNNQNSFSESMAHMEYALSRRDFLMRAGGGAAGVALASMLGFESLSGASKNPLAPKAGQHKATAKRVIFLFMEGGPSHIDMFDPKPLLNDLHGTTLPKNFKEPVTAMGEQGSPLMGSPRTWKQYGESGLTVSDWCPNIAKHADELAVIRSCQADGLNHVGSVCQMNTGSVVGGRPSLGAWAVYGLGSLNKNLPSYVVLTDGKKLPLGGVRNWGTGFMPATYQGTLFQQGPLPIPNLNPPQGVTDSRQRLKLDLLSRMNQRHAQQNAFDDELEARIESYEMAYRMQADAPEAVDLSQESEATKSMYGLDREITESFGKQCLQARRLAERGVRFIQVYSGAGSGWDTHQNHEERGQKVCESMDQPVAALLTDLKRRGLLEDTLVVWGGEFGRTPMSEKGNGRDHNPFGFTMWMAGGGIKGGQVIGSTDELGLWAVTEKTHVHDLHASILYALGLDHMNLEFKKGGRLERPTNNVGHVVDKLFV